MRYFRMRMRILSLPACPDWRKVRVGNSDGDKLPSEFEMEQTALDKLKLRRQQSLAQRHIELIRLRQELSAESIAEMNSVTTTMDFLTPPDIDDICTSPVFRRSSRSQSISLHNLPSLPLTIPPDNILVPIQKRTLHLSGDEMIDFHRTKKLKELRKELDEFAVLHNPTLLEEDNEIEKYSRDSLAQRFKGSNFTLISHDGIENGKDFPEICHKIQKMRENELYKARKANHLLEYKLKMKMSEEDAN